MGVCGNHWKYLQLRSCKIWCKSVRKHLFHDQITFLKILKKFFWGSRRWEPPRWGHGPARQIGSSSLIEEELLGKFVHDLNLTGSTIKRTLMVVIISSDQVRSVEKSMVALGSRVDWMFCTHARVDPETNQRFHIVIFSFLPQTSVDLGVLAALVED